jgi:hypothetical protein
MNEALNQLLKDCAAAPGVIGCGVRLPDRTTHVRSHDRDCSKEALEKNLVHLANATALLINHDFAAQRISWTFAGGRIFVAIRPDGALFSLVTRVDAKAGEFFDRMTLQFLSA